MTRILNVHGIGGHPKGAQWEVDWRKAVDHGMNAAGVVNTKGAYTQEFVYLDDIFLDYPISFWDTTEALAKLIGSAITAPFREARGVGSGLRMSAGMVVQWVENDEIRKRTRERLIGAIEQFKPHVIIGHSLGSLVCYDTFSSAKGASAIRERIFVSAGSQIGNPFVTGNFDAGRLTPLKTAKYWYHLYNREDDIFAAPIRMSAQNFLQVDTPFDIAGFADHDIVEYLKHPRAVETVWSRIVLEKQRPELYRKVGRGTSSKADSVAPPKKKETSARVTWSRSPKHRALLVGINDYPDPSMNLSGCVNDSFLMSSVLQEGGIPAEDIRLVLNERATAAAIKDRLEWLLDGVQPGDNRYFFFSGHGAQLPTYGLGDRVDRMDEALVSYDFDWTPDRAVVDDWFYQFYANLPDEVNFVAIFDCCHSGGISRDGRFRARGLSAPDDVRHRAIRWNWDRQLWVDRDLVERSTDEKAPRRIKLGQAHSVSTARIASGKEVGQIGKGRSRVQQKRRRPSGPGKPGPYEPIILSACAEDELAFEYVHGSVSFGAFTYCLAKAVRRHWDSGRRTMPTFVQLKDLVKNELFEVGYEQTPQTVGSSRAATTRIPRRIPYIE